MSVASPTPRRLQLDCARDRRVGRSDRMTLVTNKIYLLSALDAWMKQLPWNTSHLRLVLLGRWECER